MRLVIPQWALDNRLFHLRRYSHFLQSPCCAHGANGDGRNKPFSALARRDVGKKLYVEGSELLEEADYKFTREWCDCSSSAHSRDLLPGHDQLSKRYSSTLKAQGFLALFERTLSYDSTKQGDARYQESRPARGCLCPEKQVSLAILSIEMS
jgi:hypothetical protein